MRTFEQFLLEAPLGAAPGGIAAPGALPPGGPVGAPGALPPMGGMPPPGGGLGGMPPPMGAPPGMPGQPGAPAAPMKMKSYNVWDVLEKILDGNKKASANS